MGKLLCTTLYYFVLLCTTVYYFVLLCTTLYYCVLLCTTVYYFVLQLSTVNAVGEELSLLHRVDPHVLRAMPLGFHPFVRRMIANMDLLGFSHQQVQLEVQLLRSTRATQVQLYVDLLIICDW